MQDTLKGLSVTIKADNLTAGVKACAMARDKGRNALDVLTDYRLEFEGGKLLIISTDRYKLIRVTIDAGDISGDIEGLSVDGEQLDAIAAHKLAKGAGDDVSLTIGGDGLTATFSDGATLRAGATGRRFPNYLTLLEGNEDEPAPVISFDPKRLSDIAKACAIVAGDKVELVLSAKHKPAIFAGNGDGVAITALLMPLRVKD